MAELQTISAVLGIVKNTWHAVEFARSAYHARSDATQLWERTSDLYLLVEKIDSVIQGHTDPFDEDIILIVQKALKASNRTLDELARRCLNLGDKEDLSLASRITRPIYFTLTQKSIHKFEQQLQTNIMSVQIAFYLLDRGQKQELTRRVQDLLNTIETAMNYVARHTPSTHGDMLEQSGPSFAALQTLDECIEAASVTIAEPSTTSSSSPQLRLMEEDDIPDSPIFRLTSQETRAWGELAEQPSRSIVRRETASATSSTTLIDTIAHHSRDRFQQLLDDGVNIDSTDDQGHTPLMHTVYQHGKSCNDCLACMHKLLQFNVDVHATSNGETALHMSVKHDHLEAAIALLEKGANINASPPYTPLMLAVQGNQVTFVELFLTSPSRPNVNIVDCDNWGLVHHAVWRNCKDALRTLLLSNEAMGLNLDLDARCAMDWTPLMHLAENAQCSKNVKLATILLDYGADVNATDECGYPALYYAVTMGAASPHRNNFVRLLLERGADAELVRSRAPKGVVERFPAFQRSTDISRRDSAHSNLDTSPISARVSNFTRRWSRT